MLEVAFTYTPTFLVDGSNDLTLEGIRDPRLTVAGRPLAVIDPESRDEAERMYRLWCDHLGGPENRAQIDAMQAALREFANPTPPKPEEPTGLGAVVVDARGLRWMRCIDAAAAHAWKSEGAISGDDWIDYRDIRVVKILSEGVQS